MFRCFRQQPNSSCSQPFPRSHPPHLLQWYGSIPFDLGTQLQHNLLRQDWAAGGLLRLNLSPQLGAALEESYVFERQRDGGPGAALDLLPERQRLRALVVGVQAVASAYNRVLEGLSTQDRRLCRDRIRWAYCGLGGGACHWQACADCVALCHKGRAALASRCRVLPPLHVHGTAMYSSALAPPTLPRFLDRRVLPGVNKLSWASPPHQAAFWQKDALRCCKDVAAAVGELRAANAAVARTAALFRDSLLLRVERKRLFDLPDFEQRQAAHLVRVQRVEREGWLATAGSSVGGCGNACHMSLAIHCFRGFPECPACPLFPSPPCRRPLLPSLQTHTPACMHAWCPCGPALPGTARRWRRSGWPGCAVQIRCCWRR